MLERIIKLRHESVLEHITLTYSVKGLSRALLQELARHRHISLSVESTRHTLKKQLDSNRLFIPKATPQTITGKTLTHGVMLSTLLQLRGDYPDMTDDELKYFLPEFLPKNLILTVNIRELRHIIELRTNPAALKEFRVLACSLYEAVPEQYRYMLEDCVYKEEKKNEQHPDIQYIQ